jgi:hypothetical protein
MNASIRTFFLTHMSCGGTEIRSDKLLVVNRSGMLGTIPSDVFMSTFAGRHLLLITIDVAIVFVRVHMPIAVASTIVASIHQTPCHPCTTTPRCA